MRFIKGWIVATFVLTFLVIIAGGVVRTTQSGMGCPDWPTCFGKWIPPTNASELPPDFEKYLRKQDIDHTFNAFHTWIEYFNRLFGALLGLFAIVQVALLFPKKESYKKTYRLSVAYLAIVLLTGIFGAIVVKLNLSHASISVHLFFALLLLQIQLALILSLKSSLAAIHVEKRVIQWLVIFLALLVIQVSLGTNVRMYVDNVSKILHYEQRETWLAATPVAFLIHRSFSWVVLLSIIGISWYCRNNQLINKKIFLLATIIIASMITGIVLFYADMPAVAQPIHLFLASCAITQTISILLQTKTNKVSDTLNS
ncbi:COX15/CtaA family protein [Ferruginibacter albus]|uniref:COX15/CtaA family protein n=1 Tax=Ferruginibacter albus TaxID=2875540 RepID=UPI001CC4B9D4|nr:COX15/CtaA family protein [Ferruginibacter albus]UAY52276.1 COX15/CtaA family protein [Ferruginibacter albus]